MWNVAGYGGVKYSGERLFEIWWRTVVWNMVDNFDVECSRERRCWNMVDNFGVECGG